jgi:hypothetical protein
MPSNSYVCDVAFATDQTEPPADEVSTLKPRLPDPVAQQTPPLPRAHDTL